MKKQEIIDEIEKLVSYYSVWTIGITDDPKRRKDEHDNPSTWYQWKADTEKIAREVEKYFIDKGMKGAAGGGESPNWVYIFI